MHLTLIIAFAALLWFNSARPFNLLGLSGAASALLVTGHLLLVWTLAAESSRRVLRALGNDPGDPQQAQHLHHDWTFVLQLITLGGFLGELLLTGWPQLARNLAGGDDLFGLDDAIILAPLLFSILGMWLLQYPVDRALRALSFEPWLQDRPAPAVWTLGQYLSFNVRFQLLTVALPMCLIIVGSDALDRHRRDLQRVAGVVWIGDFLMGLLVCAVFALAPLMMRYTWTTSPLPAGELRGRLEELARRLRLRYRDILVWHSRGMLVNAAVMGIIPRLRYVLLSDGLLESMSVRQIEAVFGHEAGHVRCWHIPYFIFFALLTMLIGGGLLLLIEPYLSMQYSQILVGLLIVGLWGLAFGWLSHQFEYQADLAGAASITPAGEHCHAPCALHTQPGSGVTGLCVTAAREFSAALLRVAALNGIPRDEHGWRHPSIDERVEFLQRVSHEPPAGCGFLRRLQAAKVVLVAGTVLGLLVAAWLNWDWLWPKSLTFG